MEEEKLKAILVSAIQKGVNLGIAYQSTPENLKPIMKSTISTESLEWIAEQFINENR